MKWFFKWFLESNDSSTELFVNRFLDYAWKVESNYLFDVFI